MTEHEYSIEYLPSAQSDIYEIIAAFVLLGNKNGAIRIKNKLNKPAEQIRFMPYSGVPVHDDKMARAGFRMVIIEKYLMFYKIFDDTKTVCVYRVLNGKVNYPCLFE